jgi:hypothetical protein
MGRLRRKEGWAATFESSPWQLASDTEMLRRSYARRDMAEKKG